MSLFKDMDICENEQIIIGSKIIRKNRNTYVVCMLNKLKLIILKDIISHNE